MDPSPAMSMTRLPGIPDLRPDRRGEAVSHRAEAAGGQERPGLVEPVVLRRPHLVLPHLCRHDGIRECRGDGADHCRRRKAPVVGNVCQRVRLHPFGGLGEPRVMGRPLQEREQVLQDHPRVAHDGDLHGDVARDGRGVDVDVNHRGMRGELREVTRGAVVEPRSHREQEIAVLDCGVRRVGAVHADHAQEPRMLARQHADAHERSDRGHIHRVDDTSESLGAAGDVDAAPDVEEGFPGMRERLGCLADLQRMTLVHGVVAPQGDGFRDRLGGYLGEHVLRQVDEHGPRPPAARNEKSLADDAAEILAISHEVIVLRDGAGDPDDVRFLERVVPDHGA